MYLKMSLHTALRMGINSMIRTVVLLLRFVAGNRMKRHLSVVEVMEAFPRASYAAYVQNS
jgi:hypothetical protein